MWELLCDILPNGDPRREACADHPGSMCFTSGAYSQGPLYGLRRNTTLLPWVTLLVCKYIRSCTNVPFTSFVLQRNTLMRAHRDLNNAPNSSNVVLPCSSFEGGGLWLQSTTGDCPSLDGTMYGSVKNLTLPGITFDPHQWHETRPWRGHRITIAIYTIKAVADLSSEHTDILRRLEFVCSTGHNPVSVASVSHHWPLKCALRGHLCKAAPACTVYTVHNFISYRQAQ